MDHKRNIYLDYLRGISAIIERQIIKTNQVISKYNIWLSLYLVLFVFLQFIQHETESGIFMGVAVLVMIVLIFANYRWPINEKLRKCLSPVSFIASISYPVYLLHQNIGYIIIRTLEKSTQNEILLIIVPIAIVIGIAWICHMCIEAQSDKVGKSIIKTINSKKGGIL